MSPKRQSHPPTEIIIVPNLSKAQAERGIPAITAIRNLIESAAPPAGVDLPAWSKIRESILSQLDNQLRHAQLKLGRADAPRPQRPSRPSGGGGDRPRRDGPGRPPRSNRY
jgi:hypothetical protein